MSKETLQYSVSTPLNPKFGHLKELDVLIQPDVGGRYEPNFLPDQTITIVRPSARNLPVTEPQNKEFPLPEVAPDLVINPDLKEAGYDVLMEMRRLIKDVNTNLKQGKVLLEAVGIAAGELEVNLRTYDLEIIKSKPVLPHLNRFGEKNGRLRMVGNNGEPVVNAITAQERAGSVLEASKKIEDFLLSAENNSFAVLMNPAGWNGFVDEHGQEAEPHLNAETMVFWKDRNGVLKGLTLVTDLVEEQAQQTMVSLGVSEKEMSGDNEKERLANIVKNPALISFPRFDPFEYVLDRILAVRGRSDIKLRQRDGSVEIRSVEEVRGDVRRFDALLQFSLEEERLIAGPRQYMLEEIQRLGERVVQQSIVDKIEKAILMLTRKHLNTINGTAVYKPEVKAGLIEISDTFIRRDDDFSPEIMFLKTRAGCPPKSVSSVALRGISLGSDISTGGGSFAEGDQYGSLEFECPKCKRTNRRPHGRLIPNCQYCSADVRC